MKAMKFRVNSPEHSEDIQRKLFEMGYSWGSRNGTQFEYTDAKALYAGYFGGEDITYSYELDSFEDVGNYDCQKYILSPLGTFVKASDYYKQPDTTYAPLPPDGTQALIAKQKAVADKILDKLFSIDPFAICAGGAPRDWHFGKSAADIDIFFHTRVDQLTIVEEMLKRVGIKTDGVRCAENLPEWYKLNPALKCVYECTVEGVSVQLMLMNDITHRTVVPNFPFSICKVWYKNGTIHRENIFDHCERHKVVVKTSEIYNDEHKYVQKIKGKFPDYQFFDTWEQAYKYVFEKDCK